MCRVNGKAEREGVLSVRNKIVRLGQRNSLAGMLQLSVTFILFTLNVTFVGCICRLRLFRAY